MDLMVAQGRPLPECVQREFEDHLKCGRLEHGLHACAAGQEGLTRREQAFMDLLGQVAGPTGRGRVGCGLCAGPRRI